MQYTNRLKTAVIIILFIFILGTIGYNLLEGFSYLEAFYFTLITLTTIGYGELHSLSMTGRLFTIFLIITGLGTTAYMLSTFGQLIIEGQIFRYYRRQRMEKHMNKLNQHIIVCGYGRLGSVICQELHSMGKPFVVIDKDPEIIEKLSETSFKYLEADATDDEVLIKAGIEKAKILITVLATDAQNLFTTLSARQINPNILILARYENENSRSKLIKAGANKTINPHKIGGNKAVQIVMRPNVTDILDLATSEQSIDLSMEEIILRPDSDIVGKPLKDTGIREKYDTILISIKRKDGKQLFNPPVDTILEERDIMIVIGPPDKVKQMAENEGVHTIISNN